MVLCQIYTTDATAQTYAINVFGRKKVHIVKVDYLCTGTDKFIVLKSNILRIKYGNAPYFLISTSSAFQVQNIHSHLELECDFNGNFDLEVLDTATNAIPAGFIKICLTLDITDI